MEPMRRVDSSLPFPIHLVTSVDSLEFQLLSRCIGRSTVVGLDAEWKPFRRRQQLDQHCSEEPSDQSSSLQSYPTVTVLQIACRCPPDAVEDGSGGGYVFVVDLICVPSAAVHEMLREMFVSPNVVKLGFRFKQDLLYLSSTFEAQGCRPGFDRVEPFLDITSIYHHLKTGHFEKKVPKEQKSLSTICKEVLGLSLSKELQCSDWSSRPLTEEQLSYAAADAYYLIKLFDAFVYKFTSEGLLTSTRLEHYSFTGNLGLKEIFDNTNASNNVLSVKFCEASLMLKSFSFEVLSRNRSAIMSCPSYRNTIPLDAIFAKIVELYGEQIVLKESDRKPRTTKKKVRKRLVSSAGKECAQLTGDWQGPPPWDLSLGGDGRPKFLCDVMVEGLAKHLRCVGIDAATPSCKRPESRQLINHALKEKRVLLTRDAKLMQHKYLVENQIYKVKNLLKNDQLLEVIETFQLNISEDQLMSRCTKCNGEFIQKPLSIEEAVVAARGFQRIPNCLFKEDLEFWQCIDCNQLYWEGTQYHNAVQKFINVCKLKD